MAVSSLGLRGPKYFNLALSGSGLVSGRERNLGSQKRKNKQPREGDTLRFTYLLDASTQGQIKVFWALGQLRLTKN